MQENSEINNLKEQIKQLKETVILSQNKSFFLDEKGTIRHFDNNGKFHNDDGPAIIYLNGRQEYYKHGLRHNLKGPALITKKGNIFWYKDGMVHRDDDEPAIEIKNVVDETLIFYFKLYTGTKVWCKNDKIHRNNGFAVELCESNNSGKCIGKIWVENNLIHKFEDIIYIHLKFNNFNFNDIKVSSLIKDCDL